jgi:multiple antibiotic resistance protein
MFEFGLRVFVSLFAIVEPISVLPIYISMTSTLEPHHARRVALKAVLTAFIVLAVFALTGQLIFQFFQISVNSLRVVGGVIFFIIGYEMLQARISRTKLDEEPVHEYIDDVAITPLGIPLFAGPGAITTVIIFMNESASWQDQVALFIAIVAVLTLTFIFLVMAKRVMGFLGSSGNKVLMRLMGLIVMAIAVEFFFSGIEPYVRAMLR